VLEVSGDPRVEAGVLVAVGVDEVWETRDLGLTAGIAYRNSGGKLNEKEALDLVAGNVYTALGLTEQIDMAEFVVYEGSPLELGGRVRAVGRGGGQVDVWV